MCRGNDTGRVIRASSRPFVKNWDIFLRKILGGVDPKPDVVVLQRKHVKLEEKPGPHGG